MKLRSLKLLMAVILIMQTISFTSVFADSNTSVLDDFSGTASYVGYNIVDGIQDSAIVKGQYGKALNDSSIRMYTTGGTYYTNAANTERKDQYIEYNPNLECTSSGEYVHVAFEYLRENLFSGLNVTMTFDDEDGKLWDKYILTYMPSNTTWFQHGIVLNSATVSPATKSSRYAITDNGEAWNKIDVYFAQNSDKATAFVNGVKVDVTLNTAWGSSNYSKGITKLHTLKFTHITDAAAPHPSAIQIDNVTIEKVTTVPQEIECKKLGEVIDFDDNMSGITSASYDVSSAVKNVSRFNTYKSGRPSVSFQTYANVQLSTGIYGRPRWNNSLHTSIPADATGNNGMWYCPSISDVIAGETAHLSFNIANATSENSAGVRSVGYVLSDGSVDNQDLFEMSADTGDFEFFGTGIDAKWEAEKWYKIDILFKAANEGAKVSGYINGVEYLSDYLWKTNYMKDIGQLYFTGTAGSDYYIDDISYGRFNETGIHDPESGYSLTDNADTYIDNSERIIAIESDGSVSDYVDALAEKDNVTVYNDDGIIVHEGTLDNDSWIKVSNGFGGGVYYNVGYKADKLAIGDIIYDADKKELKSQAEVGFDIKEDFNTVTSPVPTSGTVIIALYESNELVGCQPISYTGLSIDDAKEVILSNVESVQGKTAKVFIFNSENDITPLIVNKEKSDF